MAKKKSKVQALPENVVLFPGVKKVERNVEPTAVDDSRILLEISKLAGEIENPQIRKLLRTAWRQAAVLNFAEGTGLTFKE